jgi:hypothetical protein
MQNTANIDDLLAEIMNPREDNIKYFTNPAAYLADHGVAIKSLRRAEDILLALARFYKDQASCRGGEIGVAKTMTAVGVLEAYAALKGISYQEAREEYHKSEFGGDGKYW